MIKKLSLKNVASYTDGEQTVEPLKVNFLFGLTGSGKTTLSRCIASPTDEKYHDCPISWDGSPIKCAVYNRDFVKDNFSETVPGIFTLGEGTIETKALDPGLIYVFKNTKEGSFTPIIPIKDTFAVFYVKDKKDFAVADFESVKSEVNERYTKQKEMDAVRDYFEKLKASAKVKVFRLP